MGLRVRVVLVVLSLLAIAALAVPLALTLADRRTAALAAERDRQLASLADAAAMPGIPLQPLVDRYYDVYGEGVLIVDSDGRTLAARGLSTSEPDCRDGGEPRPRRRAGIAVDRASCRGTDAPLPGRRGCPQRRGAGRRRRGGGRHHCRGARSRHRLVVGGGRLSGSAAAGRGGRPCAHEVGAAPARTGWSAPSPR